MTEQTQGSFEQMRSTLNTFLDHAMQGNLTLGAGTIHWPVRICIRKLNLDQEASANYISPYRYTYPRAFFKALRMSQQLSFHIDKKSERKQILMLILDRLKAETIDIYLFHFAFFLIYGDYAHDLTEDLTAVGKRREEYYATLPKMEVIENDDYLSHAWTDLILRVGGSSNTETVYNPSTSSVRLLFESHQFGNYTGRYYEDAVWVDPVPGKEDFAVKKMGEPTSTMTPTTPNDSKEYENLQYAYNKLKKEHKQLQDQLEMTYQSLSNEKAERLEDMNTTAALRNEVLYQSRQLEKQRPLFELRTSEKDLLQAARNIIELLDRKDTENSSH